MVYLPPEPACADLPRRRGSEPADLYEAVDTAMLGFSDAAEATVAMAQSAADFAMAASDRSSAQIAQGRIERSAAQWLAPRLKATHEAQCPPSSSEPRQAPPGPERSRNG